MSGCRKRRRGSVSSEAGLVVEEEMEENEDMVDTGMLDQVQRVQVRHAEGEKQAGRASVHDCEAACLRIFRGG